MKKAALALVLPVAVVIACQSVRDPDLARWEEQARRVTIVRDNWGIAHVSGRSDADAVFGMIYAQAEDDFNRVETNYLTSLGRLAEAEGEARIFQDLRARLYHSPEVLQKYYADSPAWLQGLMTAWADGLNYYLAKNPAVKPRVMTRFEPWMALSFTEGSIGGDIERINLQGLQAFYGKAAPPAAAAASSADASAAALVHVEPTGSNGFAIAPVNTSAGRALLLINPHTSFFFRSELQMTSDEGLNAYGAVTWGQFFIYQGFNERAGWMHTSSGVDQIDEYLETVEKRGDSYVYKHGADWRAVQASVVTVPYKQGDRLAEQTFTVYRTHHGPVVRELDGKWVSVAMMHEPVKALTQSYTRTKARNYSEFRQTMELHTNSSNNTIYADADGTIAYFHANFIPRRDPAFDWSRPVDGSNPATDWRGLHTVDEAPNLLNPATGWLYNTNNWPWSAAGSASLKKEKYPVYVDRNGENARGLHAMRVLDGRKGFTIDSLISAAYDSELPWFEKTVPALVRAWEAAPTSHPHKAKLAGPVAALKAWDFRWGVASVPTSIAVFWGEDVQRRVADAARRAGQPVMDFIGSGRASDASLLESLAAATDRLTADFGAWKTPWGEINRFQRLTGDIVQPFSDAGPSLPVGFTSGTWGSLASFGARPYPGTKKWYGTSGNSFVAVVEFGERVRAKAVTAGGASGDPVSPHFNDQAERYATGNLREVYFYRDQLGSFTRRTYRPGR